MSDTITAEPTSASAAVVSNGVGGLLEFEKPLARIQTEIDEIERQHRETGRDLSTEMKQLKTNLKSTLKRMYTNLTPWETVQVARHPKRPMTTQALPDRPVPGWARRSFTSSQRPARRSDFSTMPSMSDLDLAMP